MTTAPKGFRWRWMRSPVVHFAAIAAAALMVRALWRSAAGPVSVPPRPAIVIDADRVRRLRSDFEDRWGTVPSAAQLQALVNETVEEELLYREARVLGLGYRDTSVRRRLLEKARAVSRNPKASPEELLQEAVALGLDDDIVIRRLLAEKMRLVLQQESADYIVTDAALQGYLERHRDRFVQPETVTFTHVFLSRASHGTQLARDAAAATTALGTRPPSATAARLSDPFPLGLQFTAMTASQLTGRFGKAFADQVLALQPGRWSAPLASPYGVHLVWVQEHPIEHLPPLDAVRSAIVIALMKEHAGDNLARGVARVRALYDVRVEPDVAGIAAEAGRRERTS